MVSTSYSFALTSTSGGFQDEGLSINSKQRATCLQILLLINVMLDSNVLPSISEGLVFLRSQLVSEIDRSSITQS